MPLFLMPEQARELAVLLRNYLRLPYVAQTVPGNLLEAMVEQVRGGDCLRLRTYDFVDVVSRAQKTGWQVKSLNHDTPVTWIRAKIPEKPALITASHQSEAGLQALGDAILNYCNQHVQASMDRYGLEQIGYMRLINFGDSLRLFERLLVDSSHPLLFNAADYTWRWSLPKKATKKEQLPALHGTHKATGSKHFAWHGQGENQLHFNGEKVWWPTENDPHAFSFIMPFETEKVSPETLAAWLATL